jgi:hypothetical protein
MKSRGLFISPGARNRGLRVDPAQTSVFDFYELLDALFPAVMEDAAFPHPRGIRKLAVIV